MVIGFDAKRAFNNRTGLGNYSRMLICGLAEAHQEDHFFLYSPTFHGDYRTEFVSYANISTRQPSGFDRKIPDLWRGFGISMHLPGDNVKLYHGLSHELPHGIPSNIKKVVTIHDLIIWRHPEYYKLFDRVAHRIKIRHSCDIADVVVAISEQTKADLINFVKVPEEKIRVIYQSCDNIFWQPVTEDDKDLCRKEYHLPKKYILCVGTVEPRKNQLAVVRALAELPQDIHLVILGRPHGDYESQIRDAAKQLSLTNRVDFVSNAAFEDFPAFYANAIASTYMSHFEGFGIPILESLCCDTPVVTSNLSSMPEAGGEAALYASPDDPHEIATQLNSLITNPQLREKQIALGRIQREKFATNKVINEFYKLYTSLINDSQHE